MSAKTESSNEHVETGPASGAIVIDDGTSTCRVGLACDDAPRAVIPSFVATPRAQALVSGMGQMHSYVGEEALQMRGQITIKHPVEQGVVTNWDDMEKVWHHALYKKLECQDSVEQHVLLSEPPLNPIMNREKAAQIFFESFDVPGFYLANHLVLSLLSTGRVSGIVLGSGDCVSYAMPVYEGCALRYGTKHSYLGGREMTEALATLLTRRGVEMRTSADYNVARTIKEQLAFVAAADADAHPHPDGITDLEKTYTTPDGKVITLDHERYKCAEVFFKPVEDELDRLLLPDLVRRCLAMGPDTLPEPAKNIVAAGGPTQCPGFTERLQSELVDCGGEVHRAKQHSAWLGGALLASSPHFQEMCITKEEYDEVGPSMVERRCF
ncbi:uncharacterized protein LOC135824810 [Sycon ciliatum]|uniref:uncharacterized protein LOC135824810 n=1 Tax=Sycon ciliatum TaxID=27933 RepID=UPI0031F61560